MSDTLGRLLDERARLERGFGATLALSLGGHGAVVGAMLLAAWLAPRDMLMVSPPGLIVPLPPGGGGPVVAPPPGPVAPPPPAPQVTTPAAPEPAPEPPPRVIKPPRPEERKGLPPPDAKPAPRMERTPAPRPPSTARSDARGAQTGGSGSAPTNAIPGLGIVGPAGAGVPGGTDPNGDWYLAAVQRKIWMIWTRQMKTGFLHPITVSLTILDNGTLEEGSVRIVQSGGQGMLDLAAQRAIYSAAPFSPLPRSYGTNRITIQAVFQPTE